jgi:hypothetical protein
MKKERNLLEMSSVDLKRKDIEDAIAEMNKLIRDRKTVLESGVKYDTEKTRVDLLDAEWLEAVGEVLRFGAVKYAAHNWRGGIVYSRLIGAALRHLLAIMRGEDMDKESGLPHTAHLSCCIMFLFSMMNHRKDLDDRYKNEG